MLKDAAWHSGGRECYGDHQGYSYDVNEETSLRDILYRDEPLYKTAPQAIVAHWQRHYEPNDEGIAESGCASSTGSVTALCGQEMWDLFLRHKMDYEQCINVMVATTKMIGRKAASDEVGAFCMFLHKALKICPELGKVAESPNDQA
jgi:hypothetical protein